SAPGPNPCDPGCHESPPPLVTQLFRRPRSACRRDIAGQSDITGPPAETYGNPVVNDTLRGLDRPRDDSNICSTLPMATHVRMGTTQPCPNTRPASQSPAASSCGPHPPRALSIRH